MGADGRPRQSDCLLDPGPGPLHPGSPINQIPHSLVLRRIPLKFGKELRIKQSQILEMQFAVFEVLVQPAIQVVQVLILHVNIFELAAALADLAVAGPQGVFGLSQRLAQVVVF